VVYIGFLHYRLNDDIMPLKDRIEAVLSHDPGKALSIAELAAMLGVGQDRASRALSRLRLYVTLDYFEEQNGKNSGAPIRKWWKKE
jgi:hypothetical protein